MDRCPEGEETMQNNATSVLTKSGEVVKEAAEKPQEQCAIECADDICDDTVACPLGALCQS
jgi:hypothetical protein